MSEDDHLRTALQHLEWALDAYADGASTVAAIVSAARTVRAAAHIDDVLPDSTIHRHP